MSRRAAVLGHPISHSKSPLLHAAAYRALGFDAEYTAIDVDEPELASFMRRVRQDPSWCGLSVTMPLKKAMMGLVDEHTVAATDLGVLNTVTFTPGADGPHLRGHNTDVMGIVNALRHASGMSSLHGADVSDLKVGTRPAILGGGGTSTAAIAALARLGHDAVTLFVRDPARIAEARKAAGASGVNLDVRAYDGAAEQLPGFDVVISTLPPRAADPLAAGLAPGAETGERVLLDVAYDPWPSALASAWSARGGVVVPGLEMLLYQAVEQVLLFTGTGPEAAGRVIDAMCDAVNAPRRG
ncbi:MULTISPECIES: shikimate dehydrogenase [Arthrobacter]|uniref:Shikimate dehydrogenase n=2 Tax=Arthrobacter TaxID=1663 RepID=A0ABU9KGN5_9MICC|nr:shikimate dehydrogenase [Arthrobacter sp. YJM1]MDP5226057.1 shikimate dehydrogenase [Arthrobacter sp. YJM1]